MSTTTIIYSSDSDTIMTEILRSDKVSIKKQVSVYPFLICKIFEFMFWNKKRGIKPLYVGRTIFYSGKRGIQSSFTVLNFSFDTQLFSAELYASAMSII